MGRAMQRDVMCDLHWTGHARYAYDSLEEELIHNPGFNICTLCVRNSGLQTTLYSSPFSRCK